MTATVTRPNAPAAPTAPHAPSRDRYVDMLRAGSLLVVVAWHWVFTVVVWKADGPHASNPLATTHGVWLVTWLLQVMPLFFWVGGFVHARGWQPGTSYRSFLRKRLGRLLVPAVAAAGVIGGLGLAVGALVDAPAWLPRALVLVLSPLWFLGVYMLLVLATPVAAWAHRRFGEVAVVTLAGAPALADLLRFRFDVPFASLLAWVA